MNKQRRIVLEKLAGQITDAKDELENIMGEEEECRDNMPENLQGSEKYEKANEACNAIYEAISQLEEAISNIETATE